MVVYVYEVMPCLYPTEYSVTLWRVLIWLCICGSFKFMFLLSFSSIVPDTNSGEMSHLSPSTTQADLRPAEVLDDDRGTDSGYSATPSSLHIDYSDPPSTTSSHPQGQATSPGNTSSPKISSPTCSFFPSTTTTASQIMSSSFFYQSPSGLGALTSMVPTPSIPSRPAIVGTLPNVLTLVPGQGLARFPPASVMIPPLLPLPIRPFTSVVPSAPMSQSISVQTTPFAPSTPSSADLSPSPFSKRLCSGSQSEMDDESNDSTQDRPQLSITELRAFAEEFRRRRISLGYTQGAVGSSLANMGYANFAQSTISRFEQMQLSPRNAASIKEVLAAWLQQAECYPQGALANSETLPSPTPLPLSTASSIYSTRKRKKRAVFSTAAKNVLEEAFESDPKPNRIVIEKLAKDLDMLPEEVRVWFCNKRQKEKGHRSVSSQEEEVNSTSESPVSSTTSNDDVRGRADSSSEIPQNFRIEEMCKSSSSSPVSFSV